MNEVLQRAAAFIRTMWGNMTAGQRSGLVILSILLVAALSWVIAETSRDDLVPLVPVSESDDIKAQVKKHLEQKNVYHKVKEGTVYVRRSDKESMALDLAADGLLNDDQVFKYLEVTDLTATGETFQKRWLVAVQRRAEKMIAGLDAVKKAKVQITPGTDRAKIGFAKIDAKAAVLLELRPGKILDDQAVIGIAKMVSSVEQNLRPANVTIMDTRNRLYHIPDPDSAVYYATDIQMANAKRERSLEEKVIKILTPVFVPHQGHVSVAAFHDYVFDTVRKTKATVVPMDIETDKKNITEQEVGKGGRLGLKPEGAVDKSDQGGEGLLSSKIDKSSRAKATPIVNEYIETNSPAGTQTRRATVSVVVALPKEKLQNPPMKVDEAKRAISGASGIEVDEKNITVAYVELPPPEQIQDVVTTSETLMAMIERHGGKALLGFLILVSLIFAWRVVKNAVPQAVPVVEVKGAEIEIPLPKLPEQLAIEQVETKSMQMKAGVRELVQKNPRSVATMLKRWIVGH